MRIATNKYPVIITSSYMEKAIKGYELNVIDFLLKPITFDRFYKSLLKLEAQKIKKTRNARLMPTSNLSDYLFIKTSGKLRKINYHEIVYIEDNHECVLIHTIEEALLCIESFIEIEEILPKGQFLKIDSRYIIALTKIDFVEKTRLSIKNTFLPIDVDYKEALFKIISKLQ